MKLSNLLITALALTVTSLTATAAVAQPFRFPTGAMIDYASEDTLTPTPSQPYDFRGRHLNLDDEPLVTQYYEDERGTDNRDGTVWLTGTFYTYDATGSLVCAGGWELAQMFSGYDFYEMDIERGDHCPEHWEHQPPNQGYAHNWAWVVH